MSGADNNQRWRAALDLERAYASLYGLLKDELQLKEIEERMINVVAEAALLAGTVSVEPPPTVAVALTTVAKATDSLALIEASRSSKS